MQIVCLFFHTKYSINSHAFSVMGEVILTLKMEADHLNFFLNLLVVRGSRVWEILP
jgi:hypothetical protein